MKKRPKPDDWYKLQKISRFLQDSVDACEEAQTMVQSMLCKLEHPASSEGKGCSDG